MTYTFLLFDDTCNIFQTTDIGATWQAVTSPGPLTGDLWTDLVFPVNDGDTSNFVAVDGTSGLVSPATFLTYNTATTYSFSSVSPPGDPNTAMTCACTPAGGSQVILVPIVYNAGVTPNYPQISRNGGATFSNVTGVPIHTIWAAATFSKNAQTAYLLPKTGYIYKSTDGANTWTQLSAGPNSVQVPIEGNDGTNRLRCSSNGRVIGLVDAFNEVFWLSTDGGVTWPTQTAVNAIEPTDFGMSIDGSRIIVTGNTTMLSTNGGASFTQITTQGGIVTNIDPTAAQAMIISPHSGGSTNTAYLSINGGVSFTPSTFNLVVGATGSWVAAYAFGPPAPTPPTPVPFPGNPQTPPIPPNPTPALYMRYSDDGGHTWSNYRPKGLV